MKDNKLLDKEIGGISSFIRDVKKLSIVEGVFYEAFENKKQYCRIVALYNNSLSYIKKLTEELGTIDVDVQRGTMDSLCEYWNKKLMQDGILFEVKDINRYSACQIHYSDMEAKRGFACAHILFDRNGEVEKSQKTVKEHYNLEPYSNIIDIENIDELNVKTKK